MAGYFLGHEMIFCPGIFKNISALFVSYTFVQWIHDLCFQILTKSQIIVIVVETICVE